MVRILWPLTVLSKLPLYCNCGHTRLALSQIRGLCQPCSQQGRESGITWEVAGHLYSAVKHGYAVQYKLPASQAQVGAFHTPPQWCTTPMATGTKWQGHKPGRVFSFLLHPLLPTQTVLVNRRRILKSLLLTPFLIQTYSRIPRWDPACAVDDATGLQMSGYKPIEITASAQREETGAAKVTLTGIS